MTFTDFDLSTAFLPAGGRAVRDGSGIHGSGSWFDFVLAGLLLDPATTYDFQVEYTDSGTAGPAALYVASATDDDQAAWDAGDGYLLYSSPGAETSPINFTIGPGTLHWDSAVAAGDIYLIVEGVGGMAITAVRYQASGGSEPEPPPAVGTDTSNALGGRVRSAFGQVTMHVPVVDPPAAVVLPVVRDIAIALPTPALDNGRRS